MTKKEKQLLLNDLCGRLPYGVKIRHRGQIQELHLISPNGSFMNYEYNAWFPIETCKPYLRPMSSMTEKELNECIEYSGIRELECPQIERFEDRLQWAIKMFGSDFRTIDWLNSNHFDYRELIEKRLALEAPEDMYN